MHAHFDHSLLHTRLNVETINKIHMSGDRSVPSSGLKQADEDNKRKTRTVVDKSFHIRIRTLSVNNPYIVYSCQKSIFIKTKIKLKIQKV
jgi:hypothetical protein